MPLTKEILEFEKVTREEVVEWLKQNKESPHIQGKQMAILRGLALETFTREQLSYEFKITKVRILQLYYKALKRACRVIKIEKANQLVDANASPYKIDFNIQDALLDREEGDFDKIKRIVNTSVFTILWSEKIIAALKKNNINYIGDLVTSYRKLHFTPKFGYKSMHSVEEELRKLGLKFVNEDITPIKQDKLAVKKVTKVTANNDAKMPATSLEQPGEKRKRGRPRKA